jgi:dUTP pyrophosphatase
MTGMIFSNLGLNISLVRDVKPPSRGTPGSAGIDFFIPNDYPESLCVLAPGERCFIPSGVKANVPGGYALIAFNKSGIALKKQLLVGACVVDSDYQGEIHLHLVNTSNKPAEIFPGEKLLQFCLVPVDHGTINLVEEEDLFNEYSTRGGGGFGSTGAI